jgi:basic membrane protein A and related proteins
LRRARGMKVLAISSAAIVAFGLAACGGNDNGGSSGSTPPAKANVKVGLAYDIGGRGDKSFNDAAAAGLEKAKAELNVETKELSAVANETDADKYARLKLLCQGGYNPVIAVGFAYAGSGDPKDGPVAKAAADCPTVAFAIIDSVVPGNNVASLVFAEEQGSFLVGAAAALKSKTNHIGFVGGVKVDLIGKFEAGYIAGAKAVKPDIKVSVNYLTSPPDFSGFNDPAKGKTAAEGLYDGGADVVYQAAGGSGVGVFQAATDKKKMAIGVDSDQYNTVDPAIKDVIITSMLKRVDTAVFDFVKSSGAGAPLTGVQVFDLKRDGVGYSTSGGFVDDIKAQLEDYKKKIIDGTITVPTKPAA